MSQSSLSSLTALVLATALSSSGCGSRWTPDENQCKNPFIYDLIATPEEAYTSDAVTFTAYLHNTCASVAVLAFPDYDSSVVSSLPGYEVEPFGLEGVEGVVLDWAGDETSLIYASEPLPMNAFNPGNLHYSLTVYGGLAIIDKKDTLNDYITLLSADTGE